MPSTKTSSLQSQLCLHGNRLVSELFKREDKIIIYQGCTYFPIPNNRLKDLFLTGDLLQERNSKLITLKCQVPPVAYRGVGGWGVQTPTRNSEVLTKSNAIAHLADNVQCSYSNILISLKIAEFRKPAPQDVRKKGSKILKLPRFAVVLDLQ